MSTGAGIGTQGRIRPEPLNRCAKAGYRRIVDARWMPDLSPLCCGANGDFSHDFAVQWGSRSLKRGNYVMALCLCHQRCPRWSPANDTATRRHVLRSCELGFWSPKNGDRSVVFKKDLSHFVYNPCDGHAHPEQVGLPAGLAGGGREDVAAAGGVFMR